MRLCLLLLLPFMIMGCSSEPTAEDARTMQEEIVSLNAAGKREEALALSHKLVKSFPKQSGALNSRAIVYMDMGEYEKALKDYSKALRISPHYSLFFNRGRAHYRLGHFEKAIVDFTNAIQGDQQRADFWHDRGIAHIALKQYENAHFDFSQLVALAPNQAAGHDRRASAALYLGRKDEAYAGFAKALELEPDYGDASYNLACLLIQDGKIEEGLTYLRRGFSADPTLIPHAINDTDLDVVRDTPTYQEIMAELNK